MPLLVEAAEDLFVPAGVRNNVGGREGDWREQFREPSWNNPVVRFLNERAEDVIPRRDRVWKTGPLLQRMVAALEAARQEVPTWLETTAMETRSGEVQTALFAMF